MQSFFCMKKDNLCFQYQSIYYLLHIYLNTLLFYVRKLNINIVLNFFNIIK